MMRTPSRLSPVARLFPVARLAPLALAATLVLGACGSDDDTAGEVPPVSDQSSTAGGDMMAPRPIEVAGSGGAKMSAESAAEAPMDQSMAVGDMIAPYPYQITTFVAGEGLPALPTNDVGYLFEAGTPATSEQVAELAASLGVEGEPVAVEEGTTTSWRVGPDDGSAPSLWVGGDAQLSWSYSTAWATQEMSASGCAVAGSTGAGEAEAPAADVAATEIPAQLPETEPVTTDVVCATPAPPEGVPEADEAESRTKELMVAIGLDPAAYEFETFGDEWYASVSATEQLDGSFPGRNVSTGFGAEGVMQYAGGQLAEPVRVGPYPLIDLDEALARLNDPSGFYGGGGMALDSRVARAATDEPVAIDVAEAPIGTPVDDAPSPSEPASAPTPTSEPAIEPAIGVGSLPVEPVEPPVSVVPPSIPAPESVTVTLVDVQPDVWWAWDVDGSAWLLPAYRFIGDDGGWYTVPAVTDEFLIQVPAPTPEPGIPMPVDTGFRP